MMTIANAEMAAVWDGEEGDEWTENADRYDATDRFIARRFEAETDVRPSARVVDIGCGTGKATRDIARRASEGSVLGVDLSSRMLAEARRRSDIEEVTNIDFVQADAQVHPFEPDAFDLAISVFGAMFFADPRAAFVNIGRGLRPEGRIAFLAWQRFEDNEWLTTVFDSLAAGRDLPAPAAGTPGPFGLADADTVTTLLRDTGFTNARMTSVCEPLWLGATEDEAWAFVSQMGIVRGLAEGLDDDHRSEALDVLRRRIGASATDDGVVLGSAAWLITADRP